MNNTNNQSAYAGFLRAKDIFMNAWMPSFNNVQDCENYVNGLKFSQHEIRLETLITNNSATFKFALTNNQNNSANQIFATENRLQIQDSLIGYEYGLFIAATTGTTDTAFKLDTYPNTQDFIAADVAALQSSFYSNGSLGITANKDIIMPYRGLFNHLYRPQTQQTAALGAGSPADQIRGAEDGMITMEPNILLIGSKGYDIVIQLPAAMSSGTLSNVRAVLIFRGYLAQNSTPVS